MESDQVFRTGINQSIFLSGETMIQGQSFEKVCDRFALWILENYVDQLSVVFSVSKCDVGGWLPWVEVTEANFQAGKENGHPGVKVCEVLAYHGALLIHNLRHAQGADFQLG